MRNKKQIISSSFDRDEEFSFENVPKHFESINEDSLKKVKNYCAETISRKYHGEYHPQSLQAMLQTINGEFDLAYTELLGDYLARKNNLRGALANGLADIQNDLMTLQSTINNNNLVYEEFKKCSLELLDHHVSENFRYDESAYTSLQERLNKISSKRFGEK